MGMIVDIIIGIRTLLGSLFHSTVFLNANCNQPCIDVLGKCLRLLILSCINPVLNATSFPLIAVKRYKVICIGIIGNLTAL